MARILKDSGMLYTKTNLYVSAHSRVVYSVDFVMLLGRVALNPIA